VPSSQAAEPDDSLATLAADDVEPAGFLEMGGSDSTGPFRPVEPLEPVEPPGVAELAEAAPFEPTDEDRASASFARIGAEGLGRLRARYAEVMARIAERPLDELAREELKLRAERLNPDAWVTADEVTAALEQYETVFEGLRAVVGRYPRRRRRTRK
jgi:hypothetical protein